MSRPDHSEMVKNDLEKFQGLSTGDMRDPAALLELVLAALAGLTLLAWFGSMFFLVPETIPSKLWMGAGMFGLLAFGGPAGLVFALRRGGAEIVRAVVRDFMR